MAQPPPALQLGLPRVRWRAAAALLLLLVVSHPTPTSAQPQPPQPPCPRGARYVRITGTPRVYLATLALGELRVFAATGDDGATDTSTNWALGRPIAMAPTTALVTPRTLELYQADIGAAACAAGPAELALDGDECTFAYLRNMWADNGGSLGFEVELPMPLPVRSVVLVPPRSGSQKGMSNWLSTARVTLLDDRGAPLANATASQLCLQTSADLSCYAAPADVAFHVAC